jgi:hypothetical protein
MAYVEFLRVRTSLTWHAGVLAMLTLIALYLGHNTHVDVNGTTRMLSGTPVPIGSLAAIGMFFAAIFASSQGSSLNRENVTRDLSWTKPIPRAVLALQYMAIDVAGIVVAFALTMLAVTLVLLRMNMGPVADASMWALLVLGAGVAVMWYALIQLLTFWFAPGARAIAGIIWPVALLLLGLAKIDGPLGAIVRVIDVINPLAYMSGVNVDEHGSHTQAVTTLPSDLRPLVVWMFAAVFCAIVVALWPKKEA